jgi:hypothetical protein
VPTIIKYSLFCNSKRPYETLLRQNHCQKNNSWHTCPRYGGLWFDFKGSTPIRHKFWFCANDLIRCVGRIKKKYCVNRPLVPSTWPVQVGIDLIQFKVTTLDEARFVLCEVRKCAPQTFFCK